jgi:hypothetical protein
MPTFSNYPNKWAVLLAGGEGIRLKDLTPRISGDGRRKLMLADALSRWTELLHTRVIDTLVPLGISPEWRRNESSWEAGYKSAGA